MNEEFVGSKRRDWLNKNEDYKKKSGSFLFPMLEIGTPYSNSKMNYLIDIGFVQCGFPQIVLTFDNIDDNILKEDLHRLMMCYLYVDSEYGDNNKEVNLFFDVPKEYKKDFELFTQGKYSQFSEKYKELLIKTYGVIRGTGISELTQLPNVNMYDVLYPTKEIRQLMSRQLNVDWRIINELLDPPNIELEEFKTIEELYDKTR